MHEFADPGAERTKTLRYHTTPTTLPGAAADHDDTTFTYDLAGRLVTSTTPAGTISETTYDAIGRRSSQRVGTDDGAPGNMVDVVIYEYDGGGVGNGLVTKITQHVNSTADDDRVSALRPVPRWAQGLPQAARPEHPRLRRLPRQSAVHQHGQSTLG